MDDKVSRSRFVPAPPQAIFDLLADPRKHALIDGSGTLVDAASGPERLSKGAKFGMSMKLGVSYTMKNTVEEFEEGRLIAWRHMGRHRWRYELEPTEGGTTVTETFDTTTVPALFRPITKLAGKKNPQNMEATLDRLAKHFEANQ
ncbi:MAG TPA: SRPBCC family protein [Acidimicrobiales bacterium]